MRSYVWHELSCDHSYHIICGSPMTKAHTKKLRWHVQHNPKTNHAESCIFTSYWSKASSIMVVCGGYCPPLINTKVWAVAQQKPQAINCLAHNINTSLQPMNLFEVSTNNFLENLEDDNLGIRISFCQWEILQRLNGVHRIWSGRFYLPQNVQEIIRLATFWPGARP